MAPLSVFLHADDTDDDSYHSDGGHGGEGFPENEYAAQNGKDCGEIAENDDFRRRSIGYGKVEKRISEHGTEDGQVQNRKYEASVRKRRYDTAQISPAFKEREQRVENGPHAPTTA